MDLHHSTHSSARAAVRRGDAKARNLAFSWYCDGAPTGIRSASITAGRVASARLGGTDLDNKNDCLAVRAQNDAGVSARTVQRLPLAQIDP